MPQAGISYTPSNQQAATASSGGNFPGSGLSATDSNLGITQAQGDARVNLGPQQAGVPYKLGVSAPSSSSVRDLLTQFDGFTPSQISSWGQQLFDAGFMSDSVYNSGNYTTTDVYNAFKKAVQAAATTGKALPDVLTQHIQAFAAQGGPKVKLPNIRYTAPLTSYDDVAQAADSVFQQLMGRRATNAEKAAITKTLNSAELSGRYQEAQSAYQQLLAYRGLNPDGTPASANTSPADQAPGGTPGQPSSPNSAPNTTVGPAGLPTTVTNAQGQPSTVTSGPIVTPYNAPPSPSALAYQTALQNDRPEVNGYLIANVLSNFAKSIGKVGGGS